MKKNESLQSKNFNSKNETKNKKKFIAPKIEKLGNIAAHSQTASATGNSDGGSFPNDRMGMCLTPPPSIEEHRILVTDQVCQNQFLNIITQKVKPGDVVLDLGCGSGIHSLIAAQAGAKRVYAVDGDQILQFTKKVIEKNRMGHIIECIQGHFFKVELPEKVDVIISNLGFLQSLIDLPKLKHKFLKPGGIMIPDGLSLEFSLAAIPDFYNETIKVWNSPTGFNFDFNELKAAAVNHPQYTLFKAEDLVSTIATSDKISLSQPVENFYFYKTLTMKTTQTIHGIGGWYSFHCENEKYLTLKPPVKMNSKIWTNFILPIENPLTLKKDESIDIEIQLQMIENSSQPLWTWKLIKNEQIFETHSNFSTLNLM